MQKYRPKTQTEDTEHSAKRR